MLMRGDLVTLNGATGTVTGLLNGRVIVAWRFGNTSLHDPKEVRRAGS